MFGDFRYPFALITYRKLTNSQVSFYGGTMVAVFFRAGRSGTIMSQDLYYSVVLDHSAGDATGGTTQKRFETARRGGDPQ